MLRPTVLVTGITGYVAACITSELIARGYNVRGTYRTLSKARALKARYPAGRIELVEVKDIERCDLTEAMAGELAGIFHVASPYHFKIEDPRRDMLDPAIKGTLNVLNHALDAGVRRVVITSSYAAVNNFAAGGPFRNYTYQTSDWNPVMDEDPSTQSAPTFPAYAASKAFAERAAWDFQAKHADRIEIVTVNPAMIYGPPYQEVSLAEDLNASAASIYDLISNLKSLPRDRLPLFCHVRDVAKAHILALESPRAQNKRVFCCGDEPFTWDQATRYLAEQRPSLRSRLPPVPENAPARRPIARLNTTIAKKDLGLTCFRSWQETLLETIDALVALEKKKGWKVPQSC